MHGPGEAGTRPPVLTNYTAPDLDPSVTCEIGPAAVEHESYPVNGAREEVLLGAIRQKPTALQSQALFNQYRTTYGREPRAGGSRLVGGHSWGLLGRWYAVTCRRLITPP